MTIDVFTATGTKKGTLSLPAELFGSPVNRALIHQAILRQRSNARTGIAHAKNRSEVAGSTRKLFGQKHTGNARRGSIRSPLLRGGGKAFGPRNEANFVKDMPRSMRRAALVSCLSYQAKKGAIVGLESYPDTIKTKAFVDLLGKMSLKESRKVLLVLPEKHEALWLSCRNVPGAKAILVSYLNPLDIIDARKIVFVGDSVEKAMAIFGKRNERIQKLKMGMSDEEGKGKGKGESAGEGKEKKVMKKKPTKKATAKKAAKTADKDSKKAS
jgi:large subunit ribosomal protein L4